MVNEIDGYSVEVSGAHHTIVLVAEDIKGSIARISGILADDGVNIANLRLTRKQRGGDAFMVIEVDDRPEERAIEDILALDWVQWAYRLDKVAG
jgi:L-serine dehydratase